MASPEELRLEQKARSLQLKEEALSRQAQQQTHTEQRLKTHQDNVAKTERANQLKSQDLIKRETKYADDSRQLNQERKSLLEAQQEAESKRHKPIMLIIPILLVTCIVAGYITYEQINKKQQHYNLIATASKNIDKLASILSLTQDQVIDKSTALSNKKTELDKTKNMLLGLKNTTDQLQSEITLLRGNQATTETEKAALAVSAQSLSSQLASLKTQLEDKYLTIDINEAFIDYQEHDLKVFKTALETHQEMLDQKTSTLNNQHKQQLLLEQKIAEKEDNLSSKAEQLEKLKLKFSTIQKNMSTIQNENSELKNENENLESELKKNLEAAQPPSRQK